MKVLVVGSGGREHAICLAFSKSGRVSKIYCANGNAGIAQVAECVPIKPDEIEKLVEFAAENAIDLTFVGGETSLALGIVDEFEKRGLRIVGASKTAAQLEASKAFSKDFMSRHGVPTAEFRTAYSNAEGIEILNSGAFGDENSPVVVKADGLAAGKGVVVAKNRTEAIDGINELESIAGKDAASTIVLEECLTGREVSLILFADGEDFALMPPTRDHKRIGEGDTGPNTGGMGTITDAKLLSDDQTKQIIDEMIRPTLKGCIAEGFPFRGIMFLGLMMTANGPKLLEYNVRFGDPETQSILVRLETDLVEICEAMLDGTLGELDVKWREGNSATVVLAAEGYPYDPKKGDIINGLDQVGDEAIIFHAGTALNKSGEFVTAGGRVLGITSMDDTLADALQKSYAAVDKISWKGMLSRRDIGK
ncbi:MAG TPA: phosphoribosylamine--glycine ligase [Pyrinomonadaceae bacterium]|nr:phosphoribosylamine--glycine ligase [Pyrinomonadaceae bacterium]